MTLLAVDDEREVVEALAFGLDWKSLGIDQVYTAISAMEGRELMRHNTVDILLCDIEMPHENGLSFCRWAKENYPDLECIFLTSHAEFSYAREALLLGSCDYILQPAPYKEIAASVRRAAGKIQQQRERSLLERQGREMMDSFLKLWEERNSENTAAARPRQGNEVRHEAEQERLPAYLAEAEAPDEDQERIRKVISYIQDHLDQDLRRNELAEYVHLNPEYLSKYFKKQTGYLLKDYILLEKMKLAKQLLANTNLSITMVATRVGFFNFSHFSKVFKQLEGMTPGDYRRAAKHQG